jgi:hypothetical protein
MAKLQTALLASGAVEQVVTRRSGPKPYRNFAGESVVDPYTKNLKLSNDLSSKDESLVHEYMAASKHCMMTCVLEGKKSSVTGKPVRKDWKAKCVACHHEDRDVCDEPDPHPFRNMRKGHERDQHGNLKTDKKKQAQSNHIRQQKTYCTTCCVYLCTMECKDSEEAQWSCWAWWHRYAASKIALGDWKSIRKHQDQWVMTKSERKKWCAEMGVGNEYDEDEA